MNDKAFFDTNVLIYAIARNDPRAASAEMLLAGGGIVSIQILNEFIAVVRRKLAMPWKDVTEALAVIRTLCPGPVPITLETHEAAVRIAKQYGYGIYDALVAATAIRAGCIILYSEDLQHRQVIDGRLTVRNPFV